MKITVLGYNGGYPNNEIGTTGYLVQSQNYNLLLDAGSATLIELQKHLDPMLLDAVLITHYHNDHIADLGVLQYEWQLNKKIHLERLPIYGHRLDKANFNKLTWDNATIGKEYKPDEVLDLGPFEIRFLKTQHPVPAFAVRIKEKSSAKVLTFTADTRYFDGLSEFAADSDLLITDTNFMDDFDGVKWHLNTEETAKIFDESQAKELLISHLAPKINKLDMLAEVKKFSKNPGKIIVPAKGKQIIL